MDEEQSKKLEQLKSEPKKESVGQTIIDLVRFAIIALIFVLPIRIFIAEPFVVSGSSMHPTFEDKNYLIVDKLSYQFQEPQRQDVIVFKYPNNPKRFYIKRIIGLPNETIEIDGKIVTIKNKEHKDGFTIAEPYVQNTSNDSLSLVLKEGEYFVMGDNRSASSDSRSWGVLNRNLISGKAYLRLLPFSKIDLLPGDYKLEK
jgi:signal peptidase I